MKNKAAIVILGVCVALLLIAGAITLERYYHDPIETIQAGGGWTVVLGPQNLLHDKNSKFYADGVDLKGMCWSDQKLVYVVCDNSPEIAKEWPTLGASYAKVFKGGVPDHKELFYGWLAHEILGHACDSSTKGRPLLMINIIWPQSLSHDEAVGAPIQNPWAVINKAWPGCDSPHFGLKAIPDDQYLGAVVP